jgi:hypothetical protein
MPDTHIVEGGHEWPRRYAAAEKKAIAISLGRKAINYVAWEDLQEAVEGFQWARLEDEGLQWALKDDLFVSSTNKGQRQQLVHIIRLCAEGATIEAIQDALNELDGVTCQRLGPVDTSDLRVIARAARRLAEEISKSGSDRRRARRQFIADLASIFYRLTGKRAGRSVHDGESGQFRDFVMAALEPIDAWHEEFMRAELERTPEPLRNDVRNRLKRSSLRQGCEADIKAVAKDYTGRLSRK